MMSYASIFPLQQKHRAVYCDVGNQEENSQNKQFSSSQHHSDPPTAALHKISFGLQGSTRHEEGFTRLLTRFIPDSYFDIVKLHAAPSSAPGHLLIPTFHPRQHVHLCKPPPSRAHPAGLCCRWSNKTDLCPAVFVHCPPGSTHLKDSDRLLTPV